MANDIDNGFYLWEEGIMPKALSDEESIELLKKYRDSGNPKIREQIIYGSLGIVQECVNQVAHKYVGYWDQINPSLEDLYEIGVDGLMESIERFDENKSNLKFSNCVKNHVQWKLFRNVTLKIGFHSVITKESLNAFDEESNEKSHEHKNLILSKEKDFDNLYSKMDIEYIQQKILPLLSKRERDIFLASLEKGVTQNDLSKKFCMPERECARLIKKVTDKISRMYQDGPTPLDLELKGVALSKFQIKRIQKNQELFEKYGKEFLRQYFLPTLTPREQKIFNMAVLNYRGQEMADILAENGFQGGLENVTLPAILKKLNRYAPKLQERQKKGELPKEWVPTLKQQQKIQENEKYIAKNGGRYFLQKYFLPVLANSQKMAFTKGVLEYRGETQTELAQVSGVAVSSFNKFLKQAFEKLTLIDFDVLVDFIDGKTRFEVSSGVKVAETFNYDELLRRKLIVDKHGGKARLIKYFLPTLPKLQRRVFDLLYIQQAFSSIRGLTKYLGQNAGMVCAAEKIALEKLESTNLQEIEKIDAMVENFLKDGFKRDAAMRRTSFDVKQIVRECGGEMFMREVLIPRFQEELDKEICEKYFLQGFTMMQLTYLISSQRQRKTRSYVNTLNQDAKVHNLERRIKCKILPQLEEMKEAFEDFDTTVKAFYMKKAFEMLPREEYGKINLNNAQEKIEQYTKFKESKITPELIEKAGGKIVVLREFRPTLKTKQQIILLEIMQQKSQEHIAKDVGLSVKEVGSEKNCIAKKLEAFANKNCEK